MKGPPTKLHGALVAIVEGYCNPIIAKSIINHALRNCNSSASALVHGGITKQILAEVERGLRLHGLDKTARGRCVDKIAALQSTNGVALDRTPDPVTVAINTETDIVETRMRVRELARSLGFDRITEVKVATAVSEIARNILTYAEFGSVTARCLTGDRHGLKIVATDSGPGIPNLDEVLSGLHQSDRGLGLGLRGCKKLMDEFEVRSNGSGTTVIMSMFHPDDEANAQT